MAPRKAGFDGACLRKALRVLPSSVKRKQPGETLRSPFPVNKEAWSAALDMSSTPAAWVTMELSAGAPLRVLFQQDFLQKFHFLVGDAFDQNDLAGLVVIVELDGRAHHVGEFDLLDGIADRGWIG